MNIVYLHSHDTGRYVQPYGHAMPTPNIQRLAEEGTLFRKAFCAAPTCSPSRASLLTGQWAHCSGMTGLAHRGFRLVDPRQHLAHTLRGAGYHTALIGQQHLTTGEPAELGYDRIADLRNNRVESVAPAAVDFLNESPKSPFFLSVGFFETHRVFPEPTEDPRFCLPPPPLPDTPRTRQDMAAYKASVRELDTGVGAVLDALDATGLAEDTLVIATTDHGIAFPYMKCNLTDHGIGVMLIVRGPGGFTGRGVCDALVSQIDLYPTLCELIGIEPPDWLQGRSLMPLIRGEADEINDCVFAEVSYHAAYEPKRAVRTHRWKYIRRYGDRELTVLPNIDDSPSKHVLMEAGLGDRTVDGEALFDLIYDPTERANLADHPAAADALADMRARLDRWMQDTDDPLLKGPVPLPEGARTNDPGGRSPGEKPQ